MTNLDAIYVDVDDFCLLFEPQWQAHLIETGEKQRIKPSRLKSSEVMTLLIAFHHSGFRDFKTYYTQFVSRYWRVHFPDLVSYTRMLKLLQTVLPALCSYLKRRYAKSTGLAFVDSTTLKVCHNLRIPRHKVFDGIAERGKGTMGWFYGFKLHLVMNDEGGLLGVKVTKGNIDDRKPVLDMMDNVTGKVYADKGYVSANLKAQLAEQDIDFITGQRSNMKPQHLSAWDKAMLSKRFIIETVFDQLKNIAQIDHTRHRSCISFMVNLMAGLVAYTFKDKKPSISVTRL
ncbi:IS982 family transposase [Alteromonadaceae bacterium M269]|nr:IS982 family transposase [Alteromonadaceae bacterium M269]